MDIAQMCVLNKNALDKEAEQSAANLQIAGRERAEAKAKVDALELEVKHIIAASELKIRKSDPHSYSLDKFTEASISALVEVDPSVNSAKTNLNEERARFYILDADYYALSDKSNRIKDLISLWIGGYFAGSAPVKSKSRGE